MTHQTDLDPVLNALGPFLDQIVLVGGWAAWMYPRWAESKSRHEPLVTNDVDWALPPQLLDVGQGTIGGALLEADFRPEPRGNARPPATHYVPPDATDGVYAEFLTDYFGPEGKPTTLTVSGVVAQCLRFMRLALYKPVTLEARLLPELSLPPTGLRVPHPGNFLVHKLRVVPKRQVAHERTKDLAYIYQVLRDTRPRWPEVAHRVAELTRSSSLGRNGPNR